MKHMLKQLLSFSLIAGFTASLYGDCRTDNVTSPFFFIRSQSRDKVHQVVGSVGHTHLYDMDCWWGTSDALVVYEHTFRPNRITEALFGTLSTNTLCCNDDSRIIRIQGSQVIGRDPNAWLADYFYLPVDFDSTISFKPHITNTLIVLDEYIGMDAWLCGLYFRIYGPITFTRWNLEFCETINNRGIIGYPPGYFNPFGQGASDLLHSFTAYAAGNIPQAQAIMNDDVVLQPLKYAKIRNKSKKRTGFAELRAEFGWDFLACDCAHLGVNIQGAAPTGNPPRAEFLFDPLVGNGKHWEVGAGVTGHFLFWSSCTQDADAGFYFDANLTHLFKAKQERTFDLIGKPNSRYMLAERMGVQNVPPDLFANPLPGVVTGGVAPIVEFQKEFAPVANLTTMDIKSSFALQADIVAWFNYSACNWSVDVGYNFWGTTKEKIEIDCNCGHLNSLCDPTQKNSWALKGDARVFGFNPAPGGFRFIQPGPGGSEAVTLSATEHCATITGGTNATAINPTSTDPYKDNFGVDSAQFAQTNGSQVLTTIPFGAIQIKTSLDPVTLTCNDIDFVRHQGFTHKVFAHFNYTFVDECVIPYIGVGGSGEFSQRIKARSICTNTSCDQHGSWLRVAPSFWSVWIKGGVSF